MAQMGQNLMVLTQWPETIGSSTALDVQQRIYQEGQQLLFSNVAQMDEQIVAETAKHLRAPPSKDAARL